MSASLGASRAAAHDDVVRMSARALGPLELLARVATTVRTALPYDGAGWLLVDPASELITGAVPVNVDGPLHLGLVENEIIDDDVNKFLSIARASSPVARLSVATDGVLSRSARHRKLYAPNGYGDELRAVFRTGRTVWGQVCLTRAEDQPPFSVADARLVHRVAGHVAAGLRAGHLLGRASDGTPGSPGVVVLDDAGNLVSLTEEARELLGGIPAPGLELPLGVYEVAQRARLLADGGGSDLPAAARLRASADRWLTLHGSRLAPDRTVVVVAPTRPAELAPLIVEAYGLTTREREVTELWARGHDVATVAEMLVISPHTVHDHVKAVYAKLAVGNRPELIATLYTEHARPPASAPSPGTTPLPPHRPASSRSHGRS